MIAQRELREVREAEEGRTESVAENKTNRMVSVWLNREGGELREFLFYFEERKRRRRGGGKHGERTGRAEVEESDLVVH